MASNRGIIRAVAGVAVLIALGAGVAWFMTGSTIALRLLWLSGPIALTSIGFVLLQTWLPKD
jgi:hypothetical protein